MQIRHIQLYVLSQEAEYSISDYSAGRLITSGAGLASKLTGPGRWTVKVLPAPCRLSTSMCPP
jgi:hypothetical protein